MGTMASLGIRKSCAFGTLATQRNTIDVCSIEESENFKEAINETAHPTRGKTILQIKDRLSSVH